MFENSSCMIKDTNFVYGYASTANANFKNELLKFVISPLLSKDFLVGSSLSIPNSFDAKDYSVTNINSPQKF